jgi:hypothetical protein
MVTIIGDTAASLSDLGFRMETVPNLVLTTSA